MKYALAYNEFHNLESIGIEGKAEKLIKYAYKNGNGRLKQMTYANGHTMKAIYNSIGQMVAEKWFESEAAAASSTATPIAHYKYVYDGDGNIVRSIDISGKKEYNLCVRNSSNFLCELAFPLQKCYSFLPHILKLNRPSL